MRSLTPVITMLLALASLGRFAGAPGPGSGTMSAISAEHMHGSHAAHHRGCHSPSAPSHMPCDTGRADCPMMVSCFAVSLPSVATPVECRPLTTIVPIATYPTEYAQFAPVPESPPPRA